MSKYLFIYPERLGDKGWEYVGNFERNLDYDPDNPNGEPEKAPVSLYDLANDALFALLGTRYYPVLGVDDPLTKRRGLPVDLSPELQVWQNKRQRSAAGHSWLTVRELCSFPWEEETTLILMVAAADVPHYLKNREIAGILQDRIDQGVVPKGPAMQVVEWQPTYAQAAGSEFMDEVVYRLKDRYGSVDDARVVYWFR